ncbi:alpha/beta hydrolase family protein [Sphingomonas sp.]|uniref:alpha/beta hydrolase family protein n=1 Tax=Sphingomonas sp. TaxID=28214 RepID=UPI0035A870F5
MADTHAGGRPRTLEEAKEWMRHKAIARQHPMNNLSVEDTERVLATLPGLDGASWAPAWTTAGEAAFEQAMQAQREGDRTTAREHFLRAHGFFFMGRFPCPNHPLKLASAQRERDAYIAAGALFDRPVERVTVPFDGGEGEGDTVVFLFRRPATTGPVPVVVMWGGVDAWKEQMTAASDLLLARGVATIAMDGPGTGESPVKGVPDADRQFLPVFDWIERRGDLIGRPACLGRSFGGYWATRLAHVHSARICAAVNWGGGAHYMFQPDWIAASRYPDSYLMELVETRMRMLGATSEADYLAFFERLSLLDQGLLDQPCAPMLLVNGREDKQCPVADIDLLISHGSPKSVRMFPGGHMGLTPETLPLIADWLAARAHGDAR